MSVLQPGAGREMYGPRARQLTSPHLHRLKQMGTLQRQPAWAGNVCDGYTESVAFLSGEYLPWLWYAGAWEIFSPLFNGATQASSVSRLFPDREEPAQAMGFHNI